MLENNIYKFSIITPTYNRAELLPRVYECLCNQNFLDIEWIIVDDGSTDNTNEVVQKFKKIFNIKYLYKINAGKPAAMNYGVDVANSYITISLDDDDIFCPDTLKYTWNYFDSNTGFFKYNCVGLSGLSQYENGEIIGHRFPFDSHVSDYIRYIKNKNILGDKCDFFTTKIYKEFPFPIINNEKQIAESIMHTRISFLYKTLYVNKVFYQKEFLNDGLSAQNYWYMYPNSSELFYNESSTPPFNVKLQIKHSAKYIFFAKMNHKSNIYYNAKNKNIFLLGYFAYYLYVIKEYLCKKKLFKYLLKNKSYKMFNKRIK